MPFRCVATFGMVPGCSLPLLELTSGQNEIYISTSADVNSLDTIDGKADVVSHEKFLARHPTGKIPRRSDDVGKLFMCRRGLDMRTTTYTEEFTWEDRYSGFDDLAPLVDFVTDSTRIARKRRQRAAQPHDDEEAPPEAQTYGTPKKRRATHDPTGPRFVPLQVPNSTLY